MKKTKRLLDMESYKQRITERKLFAEALDTAFCRVDVMIDIELAFKTRLVFYDDCSDVITESSQFIASDIVIGLSGQNYLKEAMRYDFEICEQKRKVCPGLSSMISIKEIVLSSCDRVINQALEYVASSVK